jgi:hypothetical protein
VNLGTVLDALFNVLATVKNENARLRTLPKNLLSSHKTGRAGANHCYIIV